MSQLWNLLYYGGVDEGRWARIRNEIDAINRKNIIFYSLLSMSMYFILFVMSIFDLIEMRENMEIYFMAVVFSAAVLLVNVLNSCNNHRLLSFTNYLYVTAFLGLGILMAISNKDSMTTTFLVLMFAIPLMFILRPIYINLIILAYMIAYPFIMYPIQEHSLFCDNMLNVTCFGIVSLIAGSISIRSKVLKCDTDYRNRYLMETDQLTGLLNRRSFDKHIQRLEEAGVVNGIKVCAFDLNGLKHVNDTLGHHAGDELIKGAAACLENVFSRYGRCYRIGGDEFMAILEENTPEIEELKELLMKQTSCFKGTLVPNISIASGFVEGKSLDAIMDLVREADRLMYQDKMEHYNNFTN